MDVSLQPGTLTILLTDIEGSSKPWELHPGPMKESVSRHDRIIQDAVEAHGGVQPAEQGEGDSTLTAFKKPSDALTCVLEIQKAFAKEPWQDPVRIRVRAALHTGELELRDERRYWGPTINRCARLRGIAHGGQTVISQATHALLKEWLGDDVFFKDMGVHHLKDLSSPEHVWQLCHPDLPAEFPPLLSLEISPNNLPLQLKSFVPRDREMEEVRKRIASSRLVTITGAGGSGKTRLALQAGAESIEQFPGGVWLVDLAPTTDPDVLIETVAKAVRVPVFGGSAGELQGDSRSIWGKVIDYLRVRHALLILDNCEHLLDACAKLAADLLQNCPDLRLLVTTREPLGIDGENAWRVPSLSTPSRGRMADPQTLTNFQSVQLFLERATAARSDFAITTENADAVAEICRRFDGIPLAIELAAARVNVLSPNQIAEMLGDQFRLLTGGSRSAVERQQTMRASIDWSYKELSSSEQVLLRRLSVFAGGATLEAAEGICSDAKLQPDEILDVLSQLVQKSLLETSEMHGRVRYRFLEMIRQYAREQLSVSEETEALRFRHRDFYLRMVEEAYLGMGAGDETPWLHAISDDYENIRAAFEWSVDGREKEEALRIASSLWVFWWHRAIRDEGWSWLQQAFALEGDASPEVLGKAYLARGYAGVLAGQSMEEKSLSGQRAVEFFESSGGPPSLDKLLALLLQGVETPGRDGLDILQRAAVEAHQLGDPGEALSLLAEGLAARREGDIERAKRLFEQAYSRARNAGNIHWSMDVIRSWLIPTLMELGDYDDARRYAVDVLGFWREREVELQVAYALNQLGYVSMELGLVDEARSEIGEALVILRKVGDARSIANVTHSQGEVEERAGNLDAARSMFVESLDLAKRIENAYLISECLWGLARLAMPEGDSSESVRLFAEAVRLQEADGAIPWARRLAQALVEAGLHEDAVQLFGAHHARSAGHAVPSLEIEDYELAVDKARTALGDDRYTQLWDEGTQMEFDSALEQALSRADKLASK